MHNLVLFCILLCYYKTKLLISVVLGLVMPSLYIIYDIAWNVHAFTNACSVPKKHAFHAKCNKHSYTKYTYTEAYNNITLIYYVLIMLYISVHIHYTVWIEYDECFFHNFDLFCYYLVYMQYCMHYSRKYICKFIL